MITMDRQRIVTRVSGAAECPGRILPFSKVNLPRRFFRGNAGGSYFRPKSVPCDFALRARVAITDNRAFHAWRRLLGDRS